MGHLEAVEQVGHLCPVDGLGQTAILVQPCNSLGHLGVIIDEFWF